MILLGNADSPQKGIGWLVEDAEYRSATRHCQTEHQEKDQRPPPGTMGGGFLAWGQRMGFPLPQPLQDFCSKEEHRRAQQTEIDEGQWQGQENAQMKPQVAKQAATLARKARGAK